MSVKRIFIYFLVGMMLLGNYSFASEQQDDFNCCDELLTDNDENLISKYIAYTKNLEENETTNFLSYEDFVEVYDDSEELADIKNFDKTFNDDENEKHEIDLHNYNLDKTNDPGTMNDLQNKYVELFKNNRDIEMDYDTFVEEYYNTNSKDIGDYVRKMDELTQSNEVLPASSVPEKWYYDTGTSLPQKAKYTKYGLLRNVKKGDIIFEKQGGFGISGHTAIVEGIFYDTKYDQFYIRIVEAISEGVCRGVLDDQRVDEKEVSVLRVSHSKMNDEVINNSVKFSLGQLGKNYWLDLSHDTSSKEEDWYCSELVWASYYNQGINLESFVDPSVNQPGITPYDLLRSKYTNNVNINSTQPNYFDITSHWAKSYILYNVNYSIMNGVTKYAFQPDGYLTRGMFVTMLYRLDGMPVDIGSYSFSDVSNSDYYYQAVTWAKTHGIVNGVSSSNFNPSGLLTREDLVVMMYNYIKTKGSVKYVNMDGKTISNAVKYGTYEYLGKYSDYSEISGYARQAVSWAVWNGILTGTSSTELSPKSNCTRAQAATFMYRLIENYIFKCYN